MGLPRLLGIDGINKGQGLYRAKAKDDYQRELIAAGLLPADSFTPTSAEEEESVISVAGDKQTTINNGSKLATAIAAAALPLAGIGAYKMLADDKQPESPPAIVAPVDPGQDTSLTYDFGIE